MSVTLIYAGQPRHGDDRYGKAGQQVRARSERVRCARARGEVWGRPMGRKISSWYREEVCVP